ncbi:hypothetical protein BC830DRAFT_1133894, partial [Chytriomyces sp. MP71]
MRLLLSASRVSSRQCRGVLRAFSAMVIIALITSILASCFEPSPSAYSRFRATRNISLQASKDHNASLEREAGTVSRPSKQSKQIRPLPSPILALTPHPEGINSLQNPLLSVVDAAARILHMLPNQPKALHPIHPPTLDIGNQLHLNSMETEPEERKLLQVLPIPTFHATRPLLDSTVSTIHMFDAFHPRTINPYKVCHMKNVCQQDGETVFFTNNAELTSNLEILYEHCCRSSSAQCTLTNKELYFCGCFSPESRLIFETLNATMRTPDFEPQPAWMISQWLQTKKHHIAHFIYSVVQLHSIMLHRASLRLPERIETIVFQDAMVEMNKYEQDLWDVVAYGAALGHVTDFRFLRGMKNSKGNKNRFCFESVHSTIRGDIYATTFEDMSAFKRAAEKLLAIDTGLTRPPPACPPRRAALITRKSGTGLRRMTNQAAVIALLHQRGIRHVDIISPSEDDTLYAQARMVSGYGFIVSSHSSQLANLVFAHNGSVVVEVGPVYKHAFSHLGKVAGTKYMSSWGHEPDGVSET